MVRAKLKVTALTEFAYGGKQVRLNCEYDPTIPEDQRFQKATPSGSFEMLIDNPVALEQFKLGTSFYVDFTPVPAPAAAGG